MIPTQRQIDLMDPRDRAQFPKQLRLTSSERKAKEEDEGERKLHDQFWGFLHRNDFEDVEYSNPNRSTRARKGRPDFLICRNNRRLGIEFKVHPNKLSTDQEKFFEMAKRQGNTCVCLYDYPSATQMMETFFNFKSR